MNNVFINNINDLSNLSGKIGVNVASILSNVIEPASVKNVVIFEKNSGFYDFDFYEIKNVYQHANENPEKLYLILSDNYNLLLVEEKYGKYIFSSNGKPVEPNLININGIEYKTKVKPVVNIINEGLNVTKVNTNDYSINIQVDFGEINVSLFDLLYQGIFIEYLE